MKNKIKLESVTGKATIYVYQDFLSQVLVYNMIQDIRNSANAKVCKRASRARYKYRVQTNENLAIGLFKEKMVGILLEKDDHKRGRMLKLLQDEMERYVLPIRRSPGHARKKNLSNKYCNNQKYSF